MYQYHVFLERIGEAGREALSTAGAMHTIRPGAWNVAKRIHDLGMEEHATPEIIKAVIFSMKGE